MFDEISVSKVSVVRIVNDFPRNILIKKSSITVLMSKFDLLRSYQKIRIILIEFFCVDLLEKFIHEYSNSMKGLKFI